MRTSNGALRPKSEAPRRPCQVERGITIFFTSNDDTDSKSTLRLQRLRLLGVIGNRADLIARLAWEPAA